MRCLSMIIRVSVVLRRTVLTLTEPERVIIRVKGAVSFAEIEIECLHSHTKCSWNIKREISSEFLQGEQTIISFQ